jgi:hypothetical protein
MKSVQAPPPSLLWLPVEPKDEFIKARAYHTVQFDSIKDRQRYIEKHVAQGYFLADDTDHPTQASSNCSIFFGKGECYARVYGVFTSELQFGYLMKKHVCQTYTTVNGNSMFVNLYHNCIFIVHANTERGFVHWLEGQTGVPHSFTSNPTNWTMIDARTDWTKPTWRLSGPNTKGVETKSTGRRIELKI